LPGARSSR